MRLRAANQPTHRVSNVLLRRQLPRVLRIVSEEDNVFWFVPVAVCVEKTISFGSDWCRKGMGAGVGVGKRCRSEQSKEGIEGERVKQEEKGNEGKETHSS